MTVSSSEYVIPRLYQNICFAVLILLAVPKWKQHSKPVKPQASPYLGKKILNKFSKAQFISYNTNQTLVEYLLCPKPLLFLQSCCTERLLAFFSLNLCVFPSSHSRSALCWQCFHLLATSKHLFKLFISMVKGFIKSRSPEPGCSKGLSEWGKN